MSPGYREKADRLAENAEEKAICQAAREALRRSSVERYSGGSRNGIKTPQSGAIRPAAMQGRNAGRAEETGWADGAIVEGRHSFSTILTPRVEQPGSNPGIR